MVWKLGPYPCGEVGGVGMSTDDPDVLDVPACSSNAGGARSNPPCTETSGKSALAYVVSTELGCSSKLYMDVGVSGRVVEAGWVSERTKISEALSWVCVFMNPSGAKNVAAVV